MSDYSSKRIHAVVKAKKLMDCIYLHDQNLTSIRLIERGLRVNNYQTLVKSTLVIEFTEDSTLATLTYLTHDGIHTGEMVVQSPKSPEVVTSVFNDYSGFIDWIVNRDVRGL